MRKMGWMIVLGLLVCGPGVGQARAGRDAGSLEGSRWKIHAVPDEAAKQQGEKATRDALIFKDGKMISTGCTRFGFSASPYTATQSGADWVFNTEQTSPKEGKTAWSGQIAGDTIHGTMVWTASDGRITRYDFQGKRARPFWSRVCCWHKST